MPARSFVSRFITSKVGALSQRIKDMGTKMKETRASFSKRVSNFSEGRDVMSEAFGKVIKEDRGMRILRGVSTTTGKAFRRLQELQNTSIIVRGVMGGFRMAGKGVGFAGKLPIAMGRTAIRHPMITAASLGAVHGIGSAIMQQAERNTQHMRKRSVAHNNLSTDGLTLALSRNRHKRR